MIEQIWYSYFSEQAFLVFISCLWFTECAKYLKGVDFVKNFSKDVYLNPTKQILQTRNASKGFMLQRVHKVTSLTNEKYTENYTVWLPLENDTGHFLGTCLYAVIYNVF